MIEMLVRKYLILLLLLPFLNYAKESTNIEQLTQQCNDHKEALQCIQAAEYYKKRMQLDLAYKFYKKSCLIDSNAKSGGIYVCNIARSLESSFPANLFKSSR